MLRLRIDPNWSRPSDLNRGPADDESVSTLNPAGVGCSRLKSQITKSSESLANLPICRIFRLAHAGSRLTIKHLHACDPGVTPMVPGALRGIHDGDAIERPPPCAS